MTLRLAARAGGAALLALCAGVPLAAQGTGTTAGLVLEVPPTARALGLGGAYAAVVGDAGDVFVNPAGMATIHHLAFGGSWERSLFGTTYTSGAFAARVGHFDLGVGLALLDFGGDSVVTPDPLDPDRGVASGATISAYQALGVGAVAYRRGMISVGASLKALQEHIGDGTASSYGARGVTGDVGVAVAVFDLMAIGAVAENVGGRLTSEGQRLALPRTVRVGFTINLVDPQGPTRLMTTTDYVAPPGGDDYWAVGVEGGAVHQAIGLVGRLGIALGRAPSDRSSLVYGGTVQIKGMRLDWSYQPYDAVGGATQRFGLRWLW